MIAKCHSLMILGFIFLLRCRGFLISDQGFTSFHLKNSLISPLCIDTIISTSTSTAMLASSRSENNDESKINMYGNNNTNLDDEISSAPVLDQVALLQKKAEELRAEIQSLQQVQNKTKYTRIVKKRKKTESWIDELLVNITFGDEESSKMEILNTVEEVARVLIERRYNQDKVDMIFNRLIEEHNWDSPMLELLADACNNVDVIEREDNPNKRWNQVVERRLRHKMFAMQYGLNPDLYD